MIAPLPANSSAELVEIDGQVWRERPGGRSEGERAMLAAWVERRSGPMRAAAFLHGVFAIAASLAGVGAMGLGWRPGADIATLLLWGMALHLLLLLPLQTARDVWRLIDRIHGRGEEAGHHLNLIAVPDQPRPLYFHLARIAVARVRDATETSSRVVALGYGAFGALLLVDAPPTMSGRVDWLSFVPSVFFGMLLGVWFPAIATGLLARLAVLQVVAAATSLGERATAAVDNKADIRLYLREGEATSIDEEWGRRGGDGWRRWLRSVFTVSFIAGAALAAGLLLLGWYASGRTGSFVFLLLDMIFLSPYLPVAGGIACLFWWRAAVASRPRRKLARRRKARQR